MHSDFDIYNRTYNALWGHLLEHNNIPPVFVVRLDKKVATAESATSNLQKKVYKETGESTVSMGEATFLHLSLTKLVQYLPTCIHGTVRSSEN